MSEKVPSTPESEPTQPDVYDVEAMKDISADDAYEIVRSHPLLQNDPYTNQIANNDFVVEVGGEKKEINPGVFVASRIAFLEQMRASSVLDDAGKIDPKAVEAAMVVSSTDRIVGEDGEVLERGQESR